MPKPEEMDPRDIPRRAQRIFGELGVTYVERGACVVGRLRDVTELRKREPYRDIVVYGKGPTFIEAFEQAEKHVADGTPDEILDAIQGRFTRLVGA